MDTLIKRIIHLTQSNPDKMAAAFKKERLTYSELADKIINIGTRLALMGVKRGDRVLFTAVSKPEMIAAYLGIQYCGAVAVFIDKNTTPENAKAVYEDAEAVLYLTDKPMKGCENVKAVSFENSVINSDDKNTLNIASLKQIYMTQVSEKAEYTEPGEGDMAELLFTTGTTGKPKGVILTYKAVYNILKNTIEGIGIREDERLLIPLPLNHSFALRVLRATLYQGATVILQNGFAFAKEIETNQETFNCTALVAVPASMEILRSQMQDRFEEILDRFRYIEIGAGSLTVEQRKRLTAQLPHTVIYNTWGSSESGGALFTNVTQVSQDEKKIATVGRPLSCVQVKVLDEKGNEIKESSPDRAGRMALKGDMLMAGYWNRSELTKETLQDGWLITSDMVYTDADGYVYMLGRADDIINVGGEKVSPIEVENAACQYEDIKECACIGVNDPNGVLGQVPVLFVVAKNSGFTTAGIQTFLANKMERYKLPQHYMLLSELPRNRMGKLDRRRMHAIWDNKGDNELMNPVMQAILTRRSIRKFTDEKIPDDVLSMILQAGYHAPTGHNMQTWRFTVVQNKQKIEQIKELVTRTAKDKKIQCYGFENPSCLILISNDVRNMNGCQDASCAAENIFLAAHSYGIGSTWLNHLRDLCDEKEIREMLNDLKIPATHRVWCMAALGYPVAETSMPARKKDVVSYIK